MRMWRHLQTNYLEEPLNHINYSIQTSQLTGSKLNTQYSIYGQTIK